MDKKSYYNFWCGVNWADSTTTTVFKDILIHSEYRINVARPNNQPKDRFNVCMCWNIILFVIWFVKLKQNKNGQTCMKLGGLNFCSSRSIMSKIKTNKNIQKYSNYVNHDVSLKIIRTRLMKYDREKQIISK